MGVSIPVCLREVCLSIFRFREWRYSRLYLVHRWDNPLRQERRIPVRWQWSMKKDYIPFDRCCKVFPFLVRVRKSDRISEKRQIRFRWSTGGFGRCCKRHLRFVTYIVEREDGSRLKIFIIKYTCLSWVYMSNLLSWVSIFFVLFSGRNRVAFSLFSVR